MPVGTAALLDSRRLENSYATLIPLLKKGMHVIDVGCGTGAISASIAEWMSGEGSVLGIDSSEHLIATGKAQYGSIPGLELVHADLFGYTPSAKADLLISARVLQWLSDPRAALNHIKEWLSPGGIVSILDYNHTRLEWTPQPPESMRRFYAAFLDWRADAGMDNEMAAHLPGHFEALGFHSIESIPADEVCHKGDPGLAIWSTVAETRGQQMVRDGFVSEPDRLLALSEYNAWIRTDAEKMVMKLADVRGVYP